MMFRRLILFLICLSVAVVSALDYFKVHGSVLQVCIDNGVETMNVIRNDYDGIRLRADCSYAITDIEFSQPIANDALLIFLRSTRQGSEEEIDIKCNNREEFSVIDVAEKTVWICPRSFISHDSLSALGRFNFQMIIKSSERLIKFFQQGDFPFFVGASETIDQNDLDDSQSLQNYHIETKGVEEQEEEESYDDDDIFIPHKSSGQDGCLICLEALTPDRLVVLRPCMHAFHPDCALEWLKVQRKCPKCKKIVG